MSNEVILKIKVKPNAKRTEIVKKDNNEWKIKISAPPVNGLANKELISVLAKEFDIPASNIEIKKGLKSKEKLVKITR